MINIVFSSSAAGSLKIAGYKNVICLEAGLAAGNISEDIPDEKRRTSLDNLLGNIPTADRKGIIDNLSENYRRNLDKILTRYADGEDLRVFHSLNSGEMREMHRLMYHLAKKEGGGVYVVNIPNLSFTQAGAEHIRGLGELAPDKWRLYTDCAFKADKDYITGHSYLWQSLKRENAPFRTVVNGRLTSVPEDYYDSFIKAEISKQPQVFNRRQVIVNVITAYSLDIGAEIIFARMEKMIADGLLVQVTPPDDENLPYRRMLKKVNL